MDHALLVERREALADERVDLADVPVHAGPEVDDEAEHLEAAVRLRCEHGGERGPVSGLVEGACEGEEGERDDVVALFTKDSVC